jgi:hypothetical protein
VQEAGTDFWLSGRRPLGEDDTVQPGLAYSGALEKEMEMDAQVQVAVVGALETLHFLNQGTLMPAAPIKLKVTQATVDYITSLKGKEIEVDNQGNVAVK